MKKLFAVLLFSLLITACAASPAEPTPDPLAIARATFDAMSTATASAVPPTSTPIPQKPALTICLAEEPNTLSFYQSPNASSLQALEGLSPLLIQKQDHQYTSQYLTDIPSTENGRIQIENVEVNKGDWVVDRFGNAVQLTNGVEVYPAGCQSLSCLLHYEEGSVQMPQATIAFELIGDLFWNDGTSMTAYDSEFAYQLDKDNESLSGNDLLKFTQSYQVQSETQLTWTSIPGYLSDNALTAIWQPLPKHVYAEQPINDYFAQAQNLSWGPYQIETIESGTLTFSLNLHSPFKMDYYPNLEFKTVGTDTQANLDKLATGECSMLANGTILSSQLTQENQSNEQYQLIPLQSNGWLHLDFAIQHQSHDDGYNLYHDQPAYFMDVLTRQGIAQCINRDAIAGLYPQSQIMPSYLSSNNPSAIENSLVYNPQEGMQKLEQANGLLGNDGIRYSQTNYILYDTKLSLDLVTEPSLVQVAELIKNDLAICGVALNIQTVPLIEFFETQRSAPLFGRNFDLALFNWASTQNETCWLYQSEAIPGEDKSIHPYYWVGWNVTGWNNPAFDDACIQAKQNLQTINSQVSQQAQTLFMQELPAIPLVETTSFIAVRNDLCEYIPLQNENFLLDLAQLGMDDFCN